MRGLGDYRALRLLAEDEDDLKVISACLQDAVGKLGDFAFLPERRRFAFVANRFLWEAAGERKTGPFFRARAGAHFDDVVSCRHLNLKTGAKDAVVELLAVRFEAGEGGAGAVVFDFAGGGAIRLEVEAINAELSDISEPWPTRTKPGHE